MSGARRVVFVDHSYHKVTASSRFFRDILGTAADVTGLACDTWRGGARVSARQIDAIGAGIAVFWQALPYLSELTKLRTPAVWVPMYDSAVHRSGAWWRVFAHSGIGVLSFCRALSRLARTYGIPVSDLTYYPDPAELPLREDAAGLRLFLWDRGDVGFAELRSVVGEQPVEYTVLRSAPDPGLHASDLTDDELAAYKVRRHAGQLTRAQHLQLLSSCNVFVAPRRLEGIGLSFLEAMAMGIAVVAPDRPTMNEYIEHGVNGYLYDPDTPSVVDLRGAAAAGERARRAVVRGHREWLASKERLLVDVFASRPRGDRVPARTAAAARLLTVGERAKGWTTPEQKAALSRLRGRLRRG